MKPKFTIITILTMLTLLFSCEPVLAGEQTICPDQVEMVWDHTFDRFIPMTIDSMKSEMVSPMDTCITIIMPSGNRYGFTYQDIMKMRSWKFVELGTIINILSMNNDAFRQPEFMEWVETWLKNWKR